MMRKHLAAAATFERDERLRLGPAAVAAGKIAKVDAEREIGAWETIRQWFAGERMPLLGWSAEAGGYSWTDLASTALRALERREAACARNPDDAARAERRDWVRWINDRVSEERDHIASINERLRSGEKAKAA
ncbi:MAG TPA: hypothetical protein VGB48_09880 [Allosphingosinicella sp.]|jgi:hypothetical protein